MATPLEVYIESGAKRVFAGVLIWPGLVRSAKTEMAALQALVDYGPRYQKVMGFAHRETNEVWQFGLADLLVVERLSGTTSTDFGAPAAMPFGDARPLDSAELERLTTLLDACWDALAAGAEIVRSGARDNPEGGMLRTGPRGGGRQLNEIVTHVIEAHQAYLSRLGVNSKLEIPTQANEAVNWIKGITRQALQDAAAGLFPAFGPRGGERWTGRYFARRSAWHILDHLWEIEDRSG